MPGLLSMQLLPFGCPAPLFWLPDRCRRRRSSRSGAPERAQDGAGAGRRTQGPGQSGKAAGPHRGPAGERAAAPDPLPFPGFPLPVAAAILPMMERSTLILAPAAAGGGDPHGQGPRRGPRTEPEPDEGPRAPARTGRQQGPPRSPGAGVKPSFPCLYEAGPCNGAAFINRE